MAKITVIYYIGPLLNISTILGYTVLKNDNLLHLVYKVYLFKRKLRDLYLIKHYIRFLAIQLLGFLKFEDVNNHNSWLEKEQTILVI